MCQRRIQRGFLEATLADLASALSRAQAVESLVNRKGFLQSLHVNARIFGTALLVSGAVLTHSLYVLCALLGCTVLLSLGCLVPKTALLRVSGTSVFLVTGIIALPSVVLTHGRIIWRVPAMSWGITDNGLRTAALLVLRAETSACLVLLLVLSTHWSAILKACASVRVPRHVLLLIGISLRYILLLSESAVQMFQSRRSRVVASLDGRMKRKIAVQTAGALLHKSVRLSEEVQHAMQSRAFRGVLPARTPQRFCARDAVTLFLCCVVVALSARF